MDHSLPGSPVHGIFQARIPEWVAIPFSRGSFQPRDWNWVSCVTGRFFTVWVTREAQIKVSLTFFCSLFSLLNFSLDPHFQLLIWYLIWMSALSWKSQNIQIFSVSSSSFMCLSKTMTLPCFTLTSKPPQVPLCYHFHIAQFQPRRYIFLFTIQAIPFIMSPKVLGWLPNWLNSLVLVLIV